MNKYLFHFDTEDLAKADPIIGRYCVDGVWRSDVCIPNVQVWQGTDSTGVPVPGWFIRIGDVVDGLVTGSFNEEGYYSEPIFA